MLLYTVYSIYEKLWWEEQKQSCLPIELNKFFQIVSRKPSKIIYLFVYPNMHIDSFQFIKDIIPN